MIQELEAARWVNKMRVLLNNFLVDEEILD